MAVQEERSARPAPAEHQPARHRSKHWRAGGPHHALVERRPVHDLHDPRNGLVLPETARTVDAPSTHNWRQSAQPDPFPATTYPNGATVFPTDMVPAGSASINGRVVTTGAAPDAGWRSAAGLAR